MGKLVEGRWVTDEEVAARPGAYERAPSQLRGWLGTPDHPAEPGRYHLYVAWNCPWAHRTLLMRALKGLEDAVGISVCSPRRTDQGWVFAPDDGYTDDLHGSAALHELYSRAVPDYTGRSTVPILWDREREGIVSNESADIVRMLGQAFDGHAANGWDPYPEPLRPQIDAWNERIHAKLNNGVYRAGFAGTQAAYEIGFRDVFETLDAVEAALGDGWLLGDALTEADARLFPTLARFDVAYHGAFKCNLRRLIDYPRLWAYARRFHALPGVAETVRFDIYRQGYNSPSQKRNPHGIVPLGPRIDWSMDDPVAA